MPYGGKLVGIEYQRVRFDRQVTGAIDDNVEGKVAIIAALRIGDLLCQGWYQPISLQAPPPSGGSDPGRRTRDLGEFILLYAVSAIIGIPLVGLPRIAQVGRCDWGSRCSNGDVGDRQLLGLLRAGRGCRDRHSRD